MKRTSIRSKDVIEELKQYTISISKKENIEIFEDKEKKILLIDKQPSFFWFENKWLPLLKFLLQNPILKKVVIDMGAIKFIVNGADVMRPGIISIDAQIEKGEPVMVVDQNNQKPLAVGIALLNGTEMQNIKTGKVIRNIHYVGDELWTLQV